MATRIIPFSKTGAAVATAAAVVAATPVLAPSISMPTPPALSKAVYELTDFATFLQYATDPAELAYAYFTGWGGAIGPINVDPQEPVQDDPWLPNCDYDCAVNGPSGIGYMLLDTLINGNQSGDEWPVSAVNYFFEGSLGIGWQYIVQQPFAPGGALENEQIYDAIALAWQGLYAFTTFYYAGLTTLGTAIGQVPLIGPYIAEGIFSYLYGYSNELTGITGPPGLSGVLAYATDLVTQALGGLGDLLPSAAAAAPAAALVADAAPALRSTTPQAVASVSAPEVSTPAVDEAPAAVEAPAGDTSAVEATVVEPVEVDEAADTAADVAVAEVPAVEAPAETVVEESEPVTPVEAPSEVADEAPAATPVEPAPVKEAAKAPKRPVRGAVERAVKSVQSALGGKKAEAAEPGDSTAAADSADSAD